MIELVFGCLLSAQRQGSAGPWHKVFAGWRRSKYFMSWSRMYPIVGQHICFISIIHVYGELYFSINNPVFVILSGDSFRGLETPTYI